MIVHAPLYIGGERRPGRNMWGFDPCDLLLEPPERTDGAHHINRECYKFWTDPATLRRRLELVPQLARRKRRGTRAEPVYRKQGIYQETDLEERERDINLAAAEGLFRLMAWIAWHLDWRTKAIGQWVGGSMKRLTRCALADNAGFPVRVDDRGRVRAYRIDRRIEDGIAAGLLWRHVEEDRSVSFKVTKLFFLVSGVSALRDHYSRKLADDAEQAKREERDRRRAELREGPAGALVANLAGASTPDEFTTGRREDEAARMVQEFRRRWEESKRARGGGRGGGGDPPS